MTTRGWFFSVMLFWIGMIVGSALPPHDNAAEVDLISRVMNKHGAQRGELILYELANGNKLTRWTVGGASQWGVISWPSDAMTIPADESYHEFMERHGLESTDF